MLRKSIIILVVVLMATAVIAKPTLKIGSTAPSFKLPTLSGKTVDLDWSLGKRIVVLSFFASWSKSCQAEAAFLNDLAAKYNYNDVKIIGVSYDRKSEALRKYVSENKIRYTIVHDKKLKTLKDFRILIIPTLFVIDQQGKIKNIYVDFDKNVKEALALEIKQLLTR